MQYLLGGLVLAAISGALLALYLRRTARCVEFGAARIEHDLRHQDEEP